MFVRRTLSIGMSIAMRAILFMLLSVQVYANNSGEAAAVFFQILFLQNIIIGFLSASGFFRSQNLKTDTEAMTQLAAYLLMILPSLGLGAAAFGVSTSYDAYGLELLLIWGGAICTSMAAPVTGLVLQKRGSVQAFSPSIISASLFLIVLFFNFKNLSGVWPYIMVAGYQTLTFFLLITRTPHLIVGALQRLLSTAPLKTLKSANENLVVGFVNVLHLLIVFFFREYWSQNVEAAVASAVFLAFRFSDTFIQLTHMVLSRTPVVGLIFGRSQRQFQFIALGMACTSAVAVMASLRLAETAFHILVFALAAQICLDFFRVPWGLSFLYQMENLRMRSYAMFVILPPVTAAAFTTFLALQGQPIALHLFFVINVLCGALLTLGLARRNTQNASKTAEL